MPLLPQVHRVTKVFRETSGPKDSVDQLVFRVRKEPLVIKVFKEHRGAKVTPDHKDIKELRGHRVIKALKVWALSLLPVLFNPQSLRRVTFGMTPRLAFTLSSTMMVTLISGCN